MSTKYWGKNQLYISHTFFVQFKKKSKYQTFENIKTNVI